MKFNYKFKIIEQVIIVSIIAVLAPMITSGIIINNINQHAVRRELGYSVTILSEVLVKNLKSFFTNAQSELNTITMAFKYLPKNSYRAAYLDSIKKTSSDIEKITMEDISVYNSKFKDKNYFYDAKTEKLELAEILDDKNCLVATIDKENFTKKLFEIVENDERQIYVLDENRNLVVANHFSQKEYDYTMKSLPQHLAKDKPKNFGKIKNQPLAYYSVSSPDLTVIVNTTSNVTNNTINFARTNIILSIVAAVLSIFIILGLYSFYLYINIKQLFKGIIAISKGNYKRKIRLLTNIFTPFELIFLANEFNKMVSEINLSYRRILQKNKELKQLDELRSNLIDTVSHEFRTPLTSITGYTSRLLRQDIEIDKETEVKSLKVIKRQAERLSRMVEDLLVIPDIEGAKLHINIDQVNLNEVIQTAIHSLKSTDTSNIKINIPQDLPLLYADKDRLEQIFINLLENAKKYATEGTDIIVNAHAKEDKAYIKIENSAQYIPEEKINTLFEKFIRLDNSTTRTTRGTGLGLYIVKGLIEAMDGKIKIHSTTENVFTVTLTMPVVND